MQQKTIIQLWGTAGSGKTETIKIAKEELIINYINPSHSYALPLPKGEINVTLTCNGLKVGIESMGDYLRYGDLNNRLNTLIPYCDIILCASRVRNDVAKRIIGARDILFLGRGINYPIALEGALKLKEISYIHAEGYAAGELKHGPIALVDENVPVIIVAPRDSLFEKTVSNMQEVAARGGQIIMITDAGERDGIGTELFDLIHVPKADAFINPLLYAIPVQLLAYHAAVLLGTDVDQPRNLAKSVTIE